MSKAINLRNDGVKVILDKERNVNLTLNDLADIEKKYNLSAFDNLDKLFQELSADKLRYLLYLGLRKNEDDDLTEEEVGNYISLSNFYVLADVVAQALGLFLPEVSEADKEDEEKNEMTIPEE